MFAVALWRDAAKQAGQNSGVAERAFHANRKAEIAGVVQSMDWLDA